MEIGETKIMNIGQSRYRVHRYAFALKITNIDNAGKRGKKCESHTVESYVHECEKLGAISSALTAFGNTCQEIDMREYLSNLCGVVSEFTYHFYEYRGVDVEKESEPAIEYSSESMSYTIKFDSFRFRNELDKNNEPTIISYDKTGKRAIKKVYELAKKGEFEGLDFSEIANKLRQNAVHYHRYCAMD